MEYADQRLQVRAIANRLRKWASIDAFHALQEPGHRDEYIVRSRLATLVAELLESNPHRNVHDALLVIEEAVTKQKAIDLDEIALVLTESSPSLFRAEEDEIYTRHTVRPRPPRPLGITAFTRPVSDDDAPTIPPAKPDDIE